MADLLTEQAYPIIRTPECEVTEWGLTKREHAAISLRVPMSGNPELDAMIREARRWDMATAAMQKMVDSPNWQDARAYEGWREEMGEEAIRHADATIARLSTHRTEGGEE